MSLIQKGVNLSLEQALVEEVLGKDFITSNSVTKLSESLSIALV